MLLYYKENKTQRERAHLNAQVMVKLVPGSRWRIGTEGWIKHLMNGFRPP